MAMQTEDVNAALVAEVERLGAELQQNRLRGEQLREQLYPALYVANAKRRISLGRLQKMTGLTRGRIHQIVHLMAEEERKHPVEPAVTQSLEPKKSGWEL